VDEAVERVRADYDAAPYESHACPESSPGRIEAIAHLFGLNSPEASGARVVEIGCATGGNLIPFAAEHPQARAVGIDLSPVQIERGREMVEAMGLDNVELIVGDIASMDLAPLGQFDYVICHGVYSWVRASRRWDRLARGLGRAGRHDAQTASRNETVVKWISRPPGTGCAPRMLCPT
jgi:SAM-dependent methyltransferase